MSRCRDENAHGKIGPVNLRYMDVWLGAEGGVVQVASVRPAALKALMKEHGITDTKLHIVKTAPGAPMPSLSDFQNRLATWHAAG